MQRAQEPVRLGASKQRVLLTLLLIRRGEVSRDVIIDALWGKGSPKDARNTLQVYVSSLRKVIGRGAIDTTPTGYRLHVESGAVDAVRFEELLDSGRELLANGAAAAALDAFSSALALWRGAALADFRYEAFAQAEAGRLDELRLACIEERNEAGLQLGEHARLVGELEALVVEQPLRERLRRQLILALYRSGRQSEALAQYQAARTMLSEELGLEPSPELRELERMILTQDPGLAAPPPTQTRLPLAPTPFVGRVQELASVIELVRQGSRRLITLTGAGGSGKTRLATEAAGILEDDYPDGAYWVPLQSLQDTRLVLPAISAAIGAKGQPDRFIRDKRMLILLDNFEHLLDAAADTAALLTTCPNLTLLATSREPLHVAAERVQIVPPMEESDAVQLFLERSQQDEDAGAIAEICRRVDCLPLAIELAAARTTAFTADQLLARLDQRLLLLTDGPRDAPDRQKTLRATIEWSHDLLEPEEQALLRRLSVFVGGCTVQAAETVCEATPDQLAALTAKNLLRHQNDRYTMLDTIHEFAQSLLAESGESDAVAAAHASWYSDLAAQARADVPNLQAARAELTRRWAKTFEEEVDNLRAAFRWLVDHAQKDRALRLADAMPLLWGRGGHDAEARRWYADAVDAAGAARGESLGRVLASRGNFLALTSYPVEAKPYLEQALDIGRSTGNRWITSNALRSLGWVAQMEGDLDEARRLFEQAFEVPDDLNAVNTLRQGLACVEIDAGNLTRARALLVDAVVESEHAQQFLVGAACRSYLAEVDRLDD